MIDRPMATIQKVVNKYPIVGCDNIEQIEVLGWQLIAKKNDFNIGDYCVYFEIGSKLFPHPIWDVFLSKVHYNIKTMKMRGTISQGLALPTSILAEFEKGKKVKIEEGVDVTKIIGVTRYDAEVEPVQKESTKKRSAIVRFLMRYKLCRTIYFKLYGNNKGDFPTHLITPTDENNIQTLRSFFNNHDGKVVYISEKLEGQSGTFMNQPLNGFFNKLFNKKDFTVCSHHYRNYDENSNWGKVAKLYSIKQKLSDYEKLTGINAGVQGEIIGSGIQKNIYGINGYDFYVFNVKDIKKDTYFTLDEMILFCETVGFKYVPILERGLVLTKDMTAKYFLDKSTGYSTLNTKVLREGIVVRTEDMKLSFKARSPEYLMANEKN
jgi:hypothetical protein